MESFKNNLDFPSSATIMTVSKSIAREALRAYFAPIGATMRFISKLIKNILGVHSGVVDYDKLFEEKHSFSFANILINSSRLFNLNRIFFPIDDIVLSESRKVLQDRKTHVYITYSKLDFSDRSVIDPVLLRKLLENALKYAGEHSKSDEQIKILVSKSREQLKLEILFRESQLQKKALKHSRELFARYNESMLKKHGGQFELYKSISMALSIMAIIVPIVTTLRKLDKQSFEDKSAGQPVE